MVRLRWFLIIALAAILAVVFWQGRGPSVAEGSFFVVEVEGEYVEAQDPQWLARLLGRQPQPLIGLVAALYKAERDDRVAGVALRMGGLDVGWAKAQEIREALGRLREAGKRTVAYVELEGYGGNLEYYVASGADAVYVAPGTRNPFVGMAMEFLFLGGLFEKLGVEVEYERIGKYKSAVESYAERGMSEANREVSEALLDDLSGRFVGDVAESRGLSADRVREIIDIGPTTPAQLLEYDLIDGIAFFDEVIEREGSPPLVRSDVYGGVRAADVGHSPVASFALIYATGAIVTGKSNATPGGRRVAASESIAEAFETASTDPNVRAIVFRIDSPGGSALASDLIWHATVKARERGKPVVASFSDLAASGGYYVAAGADRIVAQPSALTGSIGVFVLRPVLAGLLEKLDIGFESLTRGANADLLVGTRPLSPASRKRIREDVEGVYRLFVSRVAEGRDMDPDAVDAVGRGRVFTGAQAREAGLVDVLGGLRDAVREAKLLAGIDPDADIELSVYPPPKPLVQQLREAMNASIEIRARDLVDAHLPRAARATLEALQFLPEGAPVLVPPMLPEIH
jgi:protease-4